VRRAAKADANQAAVVAALRAAGATVWIIGLPVDLLVGAGGMTSLAEVKGLTSTKQPKARPYTKLQQTFFEEWRGLPVVTLTSPEDAVTMVLRMKAGHQWG
jgi:hypothetical protein